MPLPPEQSTCLYACGGVAYGQSPAKMAWVVTDRLCSTLTRFVRVSACHSRAFLFYLLVLRGIPVFDNPMCAGHKYMENEL